MLGVDAVEEGRTDLVRVFRRRDQLRHVGRVGLVDRNVVVVVVVARVLVTLLVRLVRRLECEVRDVCGPRGSV